MSDAITPAVEAVKSLPPSTVDALKQALVDIITGTVKTAGDAKDFVLAQVPDVLQQLCVFYTIWYAIAAVVLLILGTTSMIVLFTKGKSIYNSLCDNAEDIAAFIVMIIWAFGTVGVLIACAVNTYNFLMVYFAPKVWLIHYAVELVQQVKR